MTGAALVVAVALGSVVILVVVAALMPSTIDARLPVRPCDVCERKTSARVAHTHHHEPDCGIEHPAREQCRCDPWRCPACCPCDVVGLVTSPRSAP